MEIEILILSGDLSYELEHLGGVVATVESEITKVSTFHCVSDDSKNKIRKTFKEGHFSYVIIRSFITPGGQDVGLVKLGLLGKKDDVVVVVVSDLDLEPDQKKPYEDQGVKIFANSTRGDVSSHLETLIALKESKKKAV